MIAQLVDALVEVPAGTTTIGSTPESIDEEPAAPDLAHIPHDWLLKEVPRHQVALATFRISRTPVAVAAVEALTVQTGLRISLPTEEQRVRAARGDDDARRYPSGDTWVEGRANIAGSSRGRTSRPRVLGAVAVRDQGRRLRPRPDLARIDRRHGIYVPGEPLAFRNVVPD